MKLTVIVMPVLLALLLAIPAIPTARATPYGVFDVFAPTAYEIASTHGSVLYPDGAKKLDETVAILYGDAVTWIATRYFTDPSYTNYWAPYSNRSAFAPANATFLSVSMMAIARCGIPRAFQLTAISTVNTTYTSTNSPWYNAGQTDQAYIYNITSFLTSNGVLGNWTNSTTAIYLTTDTVSNGHSIYVDYVGLSFTWKYANGSGISPGGPGGPWNPAGIPDVIGLMGIMGFVGMIGVPAASLWFYRRDGGSKIYAAVMGFVAFFVCFGLFYASINGG
jgi:hypothetical protein